MKILVLDNYDSFTYNLFHYLEQLTEDITVLRNDEISLEEVNAYSHIVISPGPGLPNEAGITKELIERYYLTKPILGICLGCQAIAEFFGGKLYNQNHVAHGIQRTIKQTSTNSRLFKDIPNQIQVGLYHSWAINADELNKELTVTSVNEKGTVMSIEHTSLPIAGVQFHPESIMSEHGLKLIKNWLVNF